MSKNDLALLILESSSKFGKKVEQNLLKLRGETNKKYITNISTPRFSNGEGKAIILDSIRNKEIYIFCDIGNYGVTYDWHGKKHEMMPDEHFQDIKRVISATCGHAQKITVVMPLLYQSRQHRRKGRESLDCANALQELVRLGVKSIITFDAHDPNVINSTPSLSFENFYPSNTILEQMADDNPGIFENAIVISPDFGAMERARFYADIIRSDVGVFYKRRDLSKIVNGKNPIIEHTYMGSDVKGKNVIIVDDMISSGGSVIEVAQRLREMGAAKICIAVTFALFTDGFDKFLEAKKQNLFDTIYTTNLSYIPEKITSIPWFFEVDLSYFTAQVIDSMDRKEPLTQYFERAKETFKTVQNSMKN